MVNRCADEVEKVIIYGVSRASLELARKLEDQRIGVTIIESCKEKTQQAATAKLLWIIYLVITAALILALFCGGMPILTLYATLFQRYLPPAFLQKTPVSFFTVYLGIFAVCSLALMALNTDIVTAFSAVATCLAKVGPMANFSEISYAGKWILSFCMLLRRLEIYSLAILFLQIMWKR